MARERLSMRKITEVLRLNQDGKLSAREIARSCKLARSTVAEYLGRFQGAGLTWPVPEGMDDEKLEKLLFPAEDRDRRVPYGAHFRTWSIFGKNCSASA